MSNSSEAGKENERKEKRVSLSSPSVLLSPASRVVHKKARVSAPFELRTNVLAAGDVKAVSEDESDELKVASHNEPAGPGSGTPVKTAVSPPASAIEVNQAASGELNAASDNKGSPQRTEQKPGTPASVAARLPSSPAVVNEARVSAPFELRTNVLAAGDVKAVSEDESDELKVASHNEPAGPGSGTPVKTAVSPPASAIEVNQAVSEDESDELKVASHNEPAGPGSGTPVKTAVSPPASAIEVNQAASGELNAASDNKGSPQRTEQKPGTPASVAARLPSSPAVAASGELNAASDNKGSPQRTEQKPGTPASVAARLPSSPAVAASGELNAASDNKGSPQRTEQKPGTPASVAARLPSSPAVVNEAIFEAAMHDGATTAVDGESFHPDNTMVGDISASGISNLAPSRSPGAHADDRKISSAEENVHTVDALEEENTVMDKAPIEGSAPQAPASAVTQISSAEENVHTVDALEEENTVMDKAPIEGSAPQAPASAVTQAVEKERGNYMALVADPYLDASAVEISVLNGTFDASSMTAMVLPDADDDSYAATIKKESHSFAERHLPTDLPGVASVLSPSDVCMDGTKISSVPANMEISAAEVNESFEYSPNTTIVEGTIEPHTSTSFRLNVSEVPQNIAIDGEQPNETRPSDATQEDPRALKRSSLSQESSEAERLIKIEPFLVHEEGRTESDNGAHDGKGAKFVAAVKAESEETDGGTKAAHDVGEDTSQVEGSVSKDKGASPGSVEGGDVEMQSYVDKTTLTKARLSGECLTAEDDSAEPSPDVVHALSEKKRRVRASLATPPSTPSGLLSFARKRIDDYSFRINEAYCDNSQLCDNCYALRVELENITEKLSTLSAEHAMCKVTQDVGQSSLECVNQLKAQLTRKNDNLAKDLDDYKFIMEKETRKWMDAANDFKRQVMDLECQLESCEAGKSALEATMIQLKAQYDADLSLTISEWEKRVEHWRNLSESKESILQDLADSVKSQAAQLVKTTVEQKTEWLEKRAAQSDAELELLKEELGRTKQLAANEYSSMREKEEKLLALTIEANELKIVLKGVNGEKESLERRLEEAAVDLGKARELEEAAVQRAKVAEDVANGKAVELEQRIYALEGELLKAKESKEVLTKELAAQQEATCTLKRLLKSADEKLDLEKKHASARLEQMRKESDKQKGELEALKVSSQQSASLEKEGLSKEEVAVRLGCIRPPIVQVSEETIQSTFAAGNDGTPPKMTSKSDPVGSKIKSPMLKTKTSKKDEAAEAQQSCRTQ
ncbi:hypothetical protein Tcan_06101 [Toxocara canis]|uniref:Uncharacterized protein n=1 Tax=Toxocara canis TaxID=6265 RepID=A0A0B2V9E3_TOXCA|nr:hypothetical protein Tcan_06101 [Toxocara canis]